MGFWVFMLIMDMLIPFTLVGFGHSFLKNTPKNINAVFGYRTGMSMKNEATWEFAHHYCGRLWYRAGLVLLPVSAAAMLCVMGRDSAAVSKVGGVLCLIQLAALIGAVFPTERALKKTFDSDGNRR